MSPAFRLSSAATARLLRRDGADLGENVGVACLTEGRCDSALQLLLVATLVGALSCASTTPAEVIDRVSRQCLDAIHAGAFHPTPSRVFAVPASPKPAGTPVVVYGASWCSACRVAEEYMHRRGIPFEARDIEDDQAEDDRLAALRGAGLPESKGIPVIDVRGTVTVGFNPCVLERAWAEP
jgi:glutaredoxin